MGGSVMALIKCPECGREISDKAEVCIHCGFPMRLTGQSSETMQEIKADLNQPEMFDSQHISQTNMLTCPQCGSIISNAARSCKYCGFEDIGKYLLSLEKDKFRQERQEEERIRCEQERLRKENITSHTPKCPTCGSTNISKISGSKRWLTTGLFGLASSDVGKTMKCNHCGYKW